MHIMQKLDIVSKAVASPFENFNGASLVGLWGHCIVIGAYQIPLFCREDFQTNAWIRIHPVGCEYCDSPSI